MGPLTTVLQFGCDVFWVLHHAAKWWLAGTIGTALLVIPPVLTYVAAWLVATRWLADVPARPTAVVLGHITFVAAGLVWAGRCHRWAKDLDAWVGPSPNVLGWLFEDRTSTAPRSRPGAAK